MSSIAEVCMVNVLARLRAAPRFGGVLTDNIRRSHRTHVTKAMAPAVHLVDDDEIPDASKVGRGCAVPWDKSFTVSLFVRDDEGYSDADEIKLEIMHRLGPDNGVWPSGVRLEYGKITYESEIADGDALRVDMRFTFRFLTAPWKLDQGSE